MDLHVFPILNPPPTSLPKGLIVDQITAPISIILIIIIFIIT